MDKTVRTGELFFLNSQNWGGERGALVSFSLLQQCKQLLLIWSKFSIVMKGGQKNLINSYCNIGCTFDCSFGVILVWMLATFQQWTTLLHTDLTFWDLQRNKVCYSYTIPLSVHPWQSCPWPPGERQRLWPGWSTVRLRRRHMCPGRWVAH